MDIPVFRFVIGTPKVLNVFMLDGKGCPISSSPSTVGGGLLPRPKTFRFSTQSEVNARYIKKKLGSEMFSC